MADRSDISSRVVEDDAERVPMPGPKPVDAVTHLYLIFAVLASYGTVVRGEHNPVTLAHGLDDNAARLLSRTLLSQHELTSFEVLARLVEKDHDLERKEIVAVRVLVQAVVVIHAVREQAHCLLCLSGLMAR